MRQSIVVPASLVLASLFALAANAGVPLTPLDSYLVSHGYGGAQFIQFQNTYRLPINVNGKAGDLTIDTGSPVSVIFRATLKKFGLGQEATEQSVHGAFGKGTEKVGLTTIQALAMGNCRLMNVRAAVMSEPRSGGLYRMYGSSDGLLGLREMLNYGAVLDISNHLLLVRPGGKVSGLSDGIRNILTKQGYTPVDLTIVGGHLHVSAEANGNPCRLVVDTGAFFTTLDEEFARQAHIGGYNTGQYFYGFGTKARPIRKSEFPELKIGDFAIKNASVTVTHLDFDLRGGDGKSPAAGLLGAEYLGLHGAIFDFNDGTLYLRPRKH